MIKHKLSPDDAPGASGRLIVFASVQSISCLRPAKNVNTSPAAGNPGNHKEPRRIGKSIRKNPKQHRPERRSHAVQRLVKAHARRPFGRAEVPDRVRHKNGRQRGIAKPPQ